MGKLFALSIFYNVVIFICLAGAYTSWQNNRWIWFCSFILLGALFIIGKIKQVKDVRNLQDNSKKK